MSKATFMATEVLSELAREWEKKLSYSWRMKGALPLSPDKDYSRENAIERVIDELYTAASDIWDRHDQLNPIPLEPMFQ